MFQNETMFLTENSAIIPAAALKHLYIVAYVLRFRHDRPCRPHWCLMTCYYETICLDVMLMTMIRHPVGRQKLIAKLVMIIDESTMRGGDKDSRMGSMT